MTGWGDVWADIDRLAMDQIRSLGWEITKEPVGYSAHQRDRDTLYHETPTGLLCKISTLEKRQRSRKAVR